MSFDGVFLHHMLPEFKPMLNGKVNKITEIGDLDFIFDIRAFGKNYKLLLCFSSDFARIHLTTKPYESTQNPKGFTMLLRKHLEGYKLSNISTIGCDRVVQMEFFGFNEFQDPCKKYLFCEIMGRYSNMILTNESHIIIDSLKHDGVGEFNRIILPYAKYETPTQNKRNPYALEKTEILELFQTLSSPKEVMQEFEGVSMNLAYPIFLTKNPGESFYEALHQTPLPVLFLNQKNVQDFYFTPFLFDVKKEYPSLSVLLEEYYFQSDKFAKIKLQTNDILSFVKKQIKKNETKIERLTRDKISALNYEEFRIKGELLLTARHLKEHLDSITLYNYYEDRDITILLDSKYNVLDNSKRFFKKYQKMKTSLTHLDIQMEICQEEIAYFTLLEAQIQHADLADIKEISEELKALKYRKDISKQRKRKQKIQLLTYKLGEDSFIYVGKNNLQNEYLTHKFAKSNDLWFHVKDAPGSHVVLNKSLEEATEEEIRTAAMVAAYFSTYKDSSSVPVNYTLIRNIKKIPGKRNCFVTISNEKTIFIDPTEDFIKTLKVVK